MSTSNLPAQRQNTTEETLSALLKRYEGNIRAALPQHLKPERMLSIIRTAVATNPGLGKCSPLSVLAGIVMSSRLGLECDGTLGEAYLVPRWNNKTNHMEATFQIGYQGKVKLTRQSGEVDSVQSRLICENDHFDLVYEPEPKLIHKLPMGNRGPHIGAYVYVKYKSGAIDIFEPLWLDEALSIRDRFGPRERCESCRNKRGVREKCKACNGTGHGEITGPWITDEGEMIRKTALHRAWKWLPKTAEMRDATVYENRQAQGESAEVIVLDLPVDESDRAQIAGATDAATDKTKEVLKQKRDQKKRQATKKKSEQPAPPQQATTPETGDQPRQVTELPDPSEAFDGDVVIYNGQEWQYHEENSAWCRSASEEPRAQQSEPPAEGEKQLAGAFDFGGV